MGRRVRVGVGALLLTMVPVVSRSADMAMVARTLAERLRPDAGAVAAGSHAPRYFNATGTAVRCVALTAAEVRAGGGRHVFACAAAGGEVLGGYLSRKGKPICEPITGSFDSATECWQLQICGDGFEGCFPTS